MNSFLRRLSARQVRTGFFLLDLSLLLCLICIALVLALEPQGGQPALRALRDQVGSVGSHAPLTAP